MVEHVGQKGTSKSATDLSTGTGIRGRSEELSGKPATAAATSSDMNSVSDTPGGAGLYVNGGGDPEVEMSSMVYHRDQSLDLSNPVHTDCRRPYQNSKSNQKSKKNLYGSVYSTDSEALGGRIK